MRKVGWLSLWLVIFLTACLPGGTNFSPEAAAVQELVKNHEAIADTTHIYQNQPWRERRVVLASYMRVVDNEQMSCEAVLEVLPSANGWQISQTGTSCSIPPNTDDVTLNTGLLGIPPDEFNAAFGLVRLKSAKMVEITWQDGLIQRVPVLNSSYLTLRAGDMPMVTRVEVLDATDKVLHEIEIELDVKELP